VFVVRGLTSKGKEMSQGQREPRRNLRRGTHADVENAGVLAVGAYNRRESFDKGPRKDLEGKHNFRVDATEHLKREPADKNGARTCSWHCAVSEIEEWGNRIRKEASQKKVFLYGEPEGGGGVKGGLSPNPPTYAHCKLKGDFNENQTKERESRKGQ